MTDPSTGNAGSDRAENLRFSSDAIEHSLHSDFTAVDAPSQGQVALGSYMHPSAITAAAAPPTASLLSQSTTVSTSQTPGLTLPPMRPPVPSGLAPATDTQPPGSGLPMAALPDVSAASGPQLGASPPAAATTHPYSASAALGAAAKQLTQSHARGEDISTSRIMEKIVIDDDDEEDRLTVSQNRQLAAAKRADNQVAAQTALQAQLVANTARTQSILQHKGFGSEYVPLIGLVLTLQYSGMTLWQHSDYHLLGSKYCNDYRCST